MVNCGRYPRCCGSVSSRTSGGWRYASRRGSRSGNRLIELHRSCAKRVRGIPTGARQSLAAFVDDHPLFTPTWVARFLQQVRSYQTNFTPLIWLEQWIAEDGPSAEEAATRSNRRVALTQVTVANSITSLRTISRLDWKDFVESQSATENCYARSERPLPVDDVRNARSLPAHRRAHRQRVKRPEKRSPASPGAGEARRPDGCQARTRRLLPRGQGVARFSRKQSDTRRHRANGCTAGSSGNPTLSTSAG